MFAIKQMRERAGLSQQEAADALGETKRRYGGWEREEREINLRDAIRLADLFRCTLDELAGRKWPRDATGQLAQTLTPDERDLVATYRATDQRGRDAIDAVADSQRGMAQGAVDGQRKGAVSG